MNFKKIVQALKKKTKKHSNAALTNPFIKGAEGRKEWNDRYFNMRKAIRNWQVAFYCSLILVGLLAFVIMSIASQSRVQPFVVEMNKGVPYAIKPMTTLSHTDERLINFALNQFIINSRTILKDKEAQKILLNKAYAFAADDALTTLNLYFEKQDPRLISDYTLDVQIVNTLPLGKRTWQVIWDETKKDLFTGQPKETTRWLAQMSYAFGAVNTNANFIEHNPFGLYIQHLSWSKNQESYEKEHQKQTDKEQENAHHAPIQ